jgi:mannose-6-phosphate isomerase-like protein (cupin superfamily)
MHNEESEMGGTRRRVVTGHDADGKSIILSDGPPPQSHGMHGDAVGADFIEIWNSPEAVPTLTPLPATEPNDRPFTIMPPSGHLLRIIDIYPPSRGGHRTVMHRTSTLDYVVVIEGEIVLILDDSEVALRQGEAVVQRGTNHAWENRSEAMARMAFFHIDAQFSAALLATLPHPLELMR